MLICATRKVYLIQMLLEEVKKVCLPDHAQVLKPVTGWAVEQAIVFIIVVIEPGESPMLAIDWVESAVGVTFVDGD